MSPSSKLVGAAHASTHAWEVLERLVDVGSRMAGSAGEARGASILADDFVESGLRDVETTEFEIPGWTRGSSALAVTGPVDRAFEAPHELVALPGTPAGTVGAEVVDVGYALPPDLERADVEGTLALATASTGDPEGYHRPLHRTEKYRRVADAGAAGLLFYGGPAGCLPPTGWAVFERRDATPGPIPAVGVSREVGARLARWAARDAVGARLAVDCGNAPATSRNVEAVVGPETEEEVLVTAHVDAHDLGDGARDDGAGCALVAEVGRLLAAVSGDLDARVRLVGFGSEEAGLYGAAHWAATHDLSRVKCVCNLDGIGDSRDLRVSTHGFEPLREAFAAVAAAADVPVALDDRANVFADGWAFSRRGVPTAACGSVHAASSRRWGLDRLWSHTHADTLDKLDPRDLRDLAGPLAAAVVRLADASVEIPHAEPDAVREAVPSASEEEMRTTGRWPWS
jgi:Zn-dependent M28 family amino/carboxypeptidase